MTDRAVLVTGASRGIGAAVARAFAEAGDRVALHHRASPALVESVRTSLPGSEHFVVQAELADPLAVQAMVQDVAREFGRIDVLVNNAGIYVEHRIDDVTYDEWQRAWEQTLAVNLVAPANLCWCALRHMGPGGRIINVSSRGAFRGEPRQPAYGASKAGLNALSQSLARALGPRGIAVTTVAPGFVETDMAAEALSGARGEEIRAQSPLDRVGQPEEVAAAVLYLASADAELATGAVLDLNGASYLR
ncbi:SDR family NAD(P)-dependent oxidoreductase [Actinopolymorpha pittospori]|uniref:NAD(P)-dependent dehydrogenase (Short-subunit alcohol dehydrogenase family) n=1 Tax=Actinopolymorpha pittospori TaxID=648752 RepID=A0A927R9D0_9ACTN|nr:SDR family oxidoreductase [Actinopolymorpha pittospori]MBE1603855.1 NAD(P)-dependent dehydrogenase (short-subunit alcohol dehydrogenase family) [Actinopolymorpha pittospori]